MNCPRPDVPRKVKVRGAQIGLGVALKSDLRSAIRLRNNQIIGGVTFRITAIFRTRMEAKMSRAATGFDSVSCQNFYNNFSSLQIHVKRSPCLMSNIRRAVQYFHACPRSPWLASVDGLRRLDVIVRHCVDLMTACSTPCEVMRPTCSSVRCAIPCHTMISFRSISSTTQPSPRNLCFADCARTRHSPPPHLPPRVAPPFLTARE